VTNRSVTSIVTVSRVRSASQGLMTGREHQVVLGAVIVFFDRGLRRPAIRNPQA
jgi:hypothetical protein